MIELHYEHYEFSFAMEVLCLLSPTPAPLKLLCEDMSVAEQRQIRTAFVDLESLGVSIEVVRGGPKAGLVAAIVPTSWGRAKKLADEYAEVMEN